MEELKFVQSLISDSEVLPQNPEVSVGHSGCEVSHRPPNLEVSARLPESQIPVKRILTADTMKDQTKGKICEVYSYMEHFTIYI